MALFFCQKIHEYRFSSLRRHFKYIIGLSDTLLYPSLMEKEVTDNYSNIFSEQKTPNLGFFKGVKEEWGYEGKQSKSTEMKHALFNSQLFFLKHYHHVTISRSCRKIQYREKKVKLTLLWRPEPPCLLGNFEQYYCISIYYTIQLYFNLWNNTTVFQPL